MKEMITRRNFLKASAVTAAAGTFAACSGESATTSTETTSTATTTGGDAVVEETVLSPEEILNGATISAQLVQSQNSDNLQAIFTALEENTGVTFDLQVIPNEQNTSMLQMKATSDDLPDLILENLPHIFDVLLPEDSLYDFSGEEWASRLVSPEIVTHDGKVYGFPFTSLDGFQAMIYNKDLFDEKGWTVPTTVDEFEALCETIKADGITPILTAKEPWVSQVWTTSGFARTVGSDADAEALSNTILSGEKKFSDYPELAVVIDEMLAMNEKGYYNEDLATLTWDETWIRIVDKKAAMILGPANRVAEKAPVFPDTHFSMFNVPTRFDSVGYLSTTPFSSGFTVSKNSKNIEAVKAMFTLLSQNEYGSMYFANGVAGFPAFEEVSGGDIQEDVLAVLNTAAAAGKTVAEMNTYWTEWSSFSNKTLYIYLNEALAKKNMTGADILNLYQEDIDKYMKGIGAAGF